ncbi:MAG: serine/threonine protein phosphatase [Idiomarina sp.]|uniref:beta-lactamase hydrolase domain-containing protein n=1 Tax=Idiomarina sp. TaxID=1874361 RepID=UPI000C0F12FC|nr:sulfur transferase domain-containing protein [Idiomarina sp.]MAK72343.1 serine/threonine protein phosphatase [Idiomarinaceae bacterium]MBL4742187.1 serine/threonine protein phosphatase [Idiomarina sp.]MBT43418.1 serine/threonine protein phosphatase [Idiomarina sp.]PHQ77192.1 MAG: serine/threonine protein phosphatase [Idiomarina sp.]HAD49298.1 serine/threonine protein phosphatase [Idiomarina sp.]
MIRLLVSAVLSTALLLPSVSLAQGIDSPKQTSDNIWVMGVPDKEDIATFAQSGGDVVISLLSVEEMSGSEETTWTSQQGLAFFHVPVNGATGVTFENARALDRLLLTHADKNIMVHCASSNRVGALFALRAAWLDGLSTEQALEVGRQHGMTSLEDKVSKMLAK